MFKNPTILRIEDEHGDATYIRLDCIESIKPIYDITVNVLVGIQFKTIGQRIYQLKQGKPGDTAAIEILRKYIREGLIGQETNKPLFPESTKNPDALKEMEHIKKEKETSTAEFTSNHKLKLLEKTEKEGITHV